MGKFIKKPYTCLDYNKLVELYNRRDVEGGRLNVGYYDLHTRVFMRLFVSNDDEFNSFVNGFGEFIDGGKKFKLQYVEEYINGCGIDLVGRVRGLFDREFDESLYKVIGWDYIFGVTLSSDVQDYIAQNFMNVGGAGRFLLGYCDVNKKHEVVSCLSLLFYQMFSQISYVMGFDE